VGLEKVIVALECIGTLNIYPLLNRTLMADLEMKLSTTKEQLKASNTALEEQVRDMILCSDYNQLCIVGN
jgi:hypothetical protein